MSTHIKAIFFDAGGTFIHTREDQQELFVKLALKEGFLIDRTALTKRINDAAIKHNRYAELRDYRCTAESVFDNWKALLRDVFPQEIPDDSFNRIYSQLYELHGKSSFYTVSSGFENALAALKKKNIWLGIITNWDIRFESILHDLSINSYFDDVIVSAKVGIEKPSEEIYHAALRKNNIRPECSLMIGDSLEWDILPAEKIGMQTAFFSLPDDMPSWQGVRFHNWDEFLPMILRSH